MPEKESTREVLAQILERLDTQEREERDKLMPVDEEAEVQGGTPISRLAMPKVGEYYPAVIKEIRVGKLREFIDVDRLPDDVRREMEARLDREVAAIVLYIKPLGITTRQLVTLSYHMNSNLTRILLCYGKERDGLLVIEPGDEVYVKVEQTTDRYGGRRLRFVIDCPPSKQQ